jgi:hypothetical protein
MSSRGDSFAIMLGRTMAFCVHPLAAWQLLSTSWRLWILTVYAGTAYIVVLGALILTA